MSFLNISIVHRDTSNFEDAIKIAKEALEISVKYEFISLQADINMELGVLYKNIFSLDKAIEFLSIALMKYKADHNSKGEAFCLGNMGLVRAMERNFIESLKLHNEALDIFTSLGDIWGIANEISNVGNMNCVLGNFELGLKQLHIGLKEHKYIGYKYAIATDLKIIGGMLLNKGERSNGRKYLEESKNILLEIGNNQEANQIAQILKQNEGV